MNKCYWTKKDGSIVDVDTMTDLHIFNTIKMIFRMRNLPFALMPESVKEARKALKGFIRKEYGGGVRISQGGCW